MFKRHFAQLRFSSDLLFSTKMAAELATSITVGLLTPLFAQIDPIRLAEVDRSLRISADYGERLGTTNLKDGALPRLLAKYPSHGFVIDRVESDELFKTISDPPEDVMEITNFFETIGEIYIDDGPNYFYYLNDELPLPPAPAAAAKAKGAANKEAI